MKNSSKLLSQLARTLPRTIVRWKSDSEQCPRKPDVVYDHRPDMTDRGIYSVDPCDSSISFEQPRVVIVGAGMAGLSAAARLVERGITNFVILEAYERPGGRIKSSWLGDVVTELGAHWKAETCCTHPLFTMSAHEDPPRPGAPATASTRGLFSRVTCGKMPFPPTIRAYYKFRQIEQEAATIYCHGGSKQHGSLFNFMSMRIQQELHDFPDEQQHDAARIMFGLTHMIAARSSFDTALLCADHTGCFMNMPGGLVRVPLGLIGILAPLMQEIPPECIRYCKPVNCIYWGTCSGSDCRAQVFCGDGECFPADYVIITASLGVLYANAIRMFCPALPASKIDAMRCLGFGCCNKVYLEYCRPFWYWQQSPLEFDFGCGGLCCRGGWTRGITAIKPAPDSKHVISVWVVGREAMMMEGLCDRDVAEGITDVLRSCTGCCVPYPCAIQRSNWSSDPYFLGAYSYNMGLCDGSAQRGLGMPLPGPSEPVPPILLFAGEATVPGHYATVSGARLSGIREAERIVQLTVQMRGPPSIEAADEFRKQVAVKCVNN